MKILLETSLAFFLALASVEALLTPPSHKLLQINNAKDDKVLSRHRRFAVASTTGWVLRATFGISAPNQDGGTIAVVFPFQYFLDTQVWIVRMTLGSPITRGGISGRFALSLTFPTNGSGRKRRRRSISSSGGKLSPPPPTHPNSTSPTLPRRELDRLLFIQMLEDWAATMEKSKVQEKLFGNTYNINYNSNSSAVPFNAHGCTLKLLCEVARTPSSQDLLGEALQLLLAPRELLREAAEEGGGGCLADNEYYRAQAAGAIQGDCSGYEPLCGVGLTEMFHVDDYQEFRTMASSTLHSGVI